MQTPGLSIMITLFFTKTSLLKCDDHLCSKFENDQSAMPASAAKINLNTKNKLQIKKRNKILSQFETIKF